MRFLSLYSIAALLLTLASCAKDKIAGDWHGDTFIKHYGHVYNQNAADIVKTLDNGYLILGSSSSYVNNGNTASSDRLLQDKIYLVKTDSLGNELWSRSYGNDSYNMSGKKIIYSPDSSSTYLIGTAELIDVSNATRVSKQKRVVIIKIDNEGIEEILKFYPNNFGDDNYNYDMASAVAAPDRIIILSTTNNVFTKVGIDMSRIELDKTDFHAFQVGYELGAIKNKVSQGVFGEDQAVKVLLHPNGFNYFIVYNSSDANGAQGNNTANNIFTSRVNAYNMTDNDVIATNTTDGQDGELDKKFLATDASLDVINNQLILTLFLTQNTADDLNFTRPEKIAFKQYIISSENAIGVTFQRVATTYPPVASYGSLDHSYSQKGANLLVYPNDNGYLTSSSVNVIPNVNTDIQITRYDRNFNIVWSRYLGAGATMDKAGPLFFIDSTIANSNIRPIVGIGGIGTFDFGATNTMMGFFKANTQGELKANE